MEHKPPIPSPPHRGPGKSAVYGEPYQTPDGSTIIPVTRAGFLGRGVVPLGAFVVHNGQSMFLPVVDNTKIALLGETIGLVAAALSTLAMVRRPPWPDVVIRREVRDDA